jgi:hypothetical protein
MSSGLASPAHLSDLCRHAESPSGAMASWLAAKCVSAATTKLTSNGAPGHRDHVGFAIPARTGTDGQAHITSLETEPASLERSRLDKEMAKTCGLACLMPLVDRLPSAPTPILIRATWTSDHPRPRSNNTPGESARMAEPSPLNTADRYGLGTDGTLREAVDHAHPQAARTTSSDATGAQRTD